MTAKDFLGRPLKVGDYVLIKAGKHVGKKGRVLKIRQGGVGMWADLKLDLFPALRLEKRCPNLQIIREVKPQE